MNANPTPTRTRSRGLILTEHALTLLDQELRKWWEDSDTRQASKTGKLSREAKAAGLDVNVQTVDKIYRCEPVDEVTLRHVFETLNITPPFSKERYCVLAPPTSGNLPDMSNRCIGRETEVAEIKTLLASSPLVTLTGTGGVGKTRLALQVATEMKICYTAGIWLVELGGLARVTDQSLVLQTVATTLGVQEEKHCPLIKTLSDFLHGKPLLLILDNCEHLVEACATLAHHLLSSSSDLRILATSRERLNIPSELPFRVPSLAVPDLQRLSEEKGDIATLVLGFDSVRLFVERTRVLRPGFMVTNQNAPILASICQRLDGIPLAIELAAARYGAIPLAELERRLSDCFRLLTDGSKVLPRHQTLRAMMDWSYDLLEKEEQALLGRLSVFAGGWTLEAAEKVCAGKGIEEWKVLDLLISLVKKNLAVYEEREETGRYRLLETVQQYGRFRLTESGASDAVQRQHQDYFLALAEEAEIQLTGREQGEWLLRLEAEHDNVRAALNWSLSEGETSACLRFCGALQRFWYMRGYLSEGRTWCETALRKADAQEQTLERAKALYATGLLTYYQGDLAAACLYLGESLALSRQIGDRISIARSLIGLGLVVSNQGDYISARTCYEESLAVSQEVEDRSRIASSLNGLGSVAESLGDYGSALAHYKDALTLFRQIGDRSRIANALKNLGSVTHNQGADNSARAYYKESLTLFWEIGNRSGIAYASSGLGLIARSQGDYDFAHLYFEESLALCRQIGDQSGIAYSLSNLGNVSQDQGDYAAVRAYRKENLTLCRELGNHTGIIYSLEAFAGLAIGESETVRAAVLWGAAEALRRQSGLPLPPRERKRYDRAVAQARQALGEEAFFAAWERGCSMLLEQAIKYALEELV